MAQQPKFSQRARKKASKPDSMGGEDTELRVMDLYILAALAGGVNPNMVVEKAAEVMAEVETYLE